jgi:hypothetical protein
LIAGPVSANAPTEHQDEKIIQSIQNIIENKKEELKPFPIGNKNPEIRIVKTPRRNLGVFSMSEEEAMNWIIKREGGATSVNKSSLACGAPQSLPCSKLLSYAGVDMTKYNLNTYAGVKAAISTVPVEVQRAWMLQYIQRRYGTCVKARQFWIANGWY